MIERKPLIAIVARAVRVLTTDLLREAHERGHTQLRPAHDPVFATLPSGRGARVRHGGPGGHHQAVDG